MRRNIRSVAVLGSGIMGSRIACHFANAGISVLLLDMAPSSLTAEESAAGLHLDHPKVKNRIVNSALQSAIRSNPAPLFSKAYANRIKTGNFTDDLPKIKDCDWIMEVVVENLDIKRSLFEQVEKHRKPGTIITSNTSGIPIGLMAKGFSEDFRKNFCGTHFFNPPRYLKLLEIIPTPETDPTLVDFLMQFGADHLGKTTVLCKDTPAFIANRIGVFSILHLFQQIETLGLSLEEIDKITGPLIGRPKSATFRTCDVVGLDTLVRVADGLAQQAKDDEFASVFELPTFIREMVKNNLLGDKTGKGFYEKRKVEGKKEIWTLNLKTLEYEPSKKVKLPILEQLKPIDDLNQRIRMLLNSPDAAGELYRRSVAATWAYSALRIPEISDQYYAIDDAMKAGFGWELGPFEIWDLIGFTNGYNLLKMYALPIAPWLEEWKESGNTAFYPTGENQTQYFNLIDKKVEAIPGKSRILMPQQFKPGNVLFSNPGASVIHLGDGILNVEFHSKMNAIGSDQLAAIQKAIDLAEKEYVGVVIANAGQNFSAGANLGLVFMMAIEQDFDELDFAIRAFQQTSMRIRYSRVPVIMAPHGLTLGGGCEFSLHADGIQAAAETYIGLVETGVGLIPGGGGTKETALRMSDRFVQGDSEVNILQNAFTQIAMAKVATSAHEARDMGILRSSDRISMHSDYRISDAKQFCLSLAEAGYEPPHYRTNVRVMGRSGMALLLAGVNGMKMGKYISEHDQKIASKLAYVLCGGDLSQPQDVSENYLLNLEREAFLSLCGERKTLERIESILKTGKPLRN